MKEKWGEKKEFVLTRDKNIIVSWILELNQNDLIMKISPTYNNIEPMHGHHQTISHDCHLEIMQGYC